MSKNMFWVFYDSLSKAQSNPITTDEAQMAIFKMRPRDMERFFIWTQGWAECQSLVLYLKTDQSHFVSSFVTPDENTIKARIRDVLEMSPANNKKLHDEITNSFSSIRLTTDENFSEDSQQQFNADEITWSNLEKPKIDFTKIKNKKKLDYREERHQLKIEVILISNKGKTFRSKSINISLSGSLLEDNIPFDYYGMMFDVVVVNQNSKNTETCRISLKGKTVGDGLSQRLQYVEMSDIKKQELQNFLQDYIDLQKIYKKKAI